MDPITHAASGALAAFALRQRPRLLVPLAALAAASPDIDIIFGSGPFQQLLLHRGITHALPALPFFSLLVTLLCFPLLRRAAQKQSQPRWNQATVCWNFGKTWLFMALMIELHIWLDIVTTYGTMVFLPFSAERIRLNGVFIIDLLLVLPMLYALWRCRQPEKDRPDARRQRLRVARLACLWIICYPLLGVGLASLHTHMVTARLQAEAATRGSSVERVVVLPDAFAPFFWRVLWEERLPAQAAGQPSAQVFTHVVRSQGLNALGFPRTEPTAPLPSFNARQLAIDLRSSDELYRFLEFALLPVFAPLPESDRWQAPDPSGNRLQYRIYDLRFGSAVGWVQKLMSKRPNADIPFQFMLALQPGSQSPAGNNPASIEQVRLRFSDTRKDSGWHAPKPLPLLPWKTPSDQQPSASWLQWAVGL